MQQLLQNPMRHQNLVLPSSMLLQDQDALQPNVPSVKVLVARVFFKKMRVLVHCIGVRPLLKGETPKLSRKRRPLSQLLREPVYMLGSLHARSPKNSIHLLLTAGEKYGVSQWWISVFKLLDTMIKG
jgi:hypothetical protein